MKSFLDRKTSCCFLILFAALDLMAQPDSDKVRAAVEGLSSCGQFIQKDEQFVYTGFGPYWTGHEQPRRPLAGKLIAKSLASGKEVALVTLDSAIDALRFGDYLYILTFSGIEEWKVGTWDRQAVYKTHMLGRPLLDEEHPRGFAIKDNIIVVAHGRLGLSFFDLSSRKLLRSYPVLLGFRPLESVVNDVSVAGDKALAVVDSYNVVDPKDPQPFRGILRVNLQSMEVEAELGGLPPGADSIVSDSSVAIVSFYGSPLWKYGNPNLNGATLPEPLQKVWRFPFEGYPKGKAVIDDRFYYTCFNKVPGPGEGNTYMRIPMVLDRRVLQLQGMGQF